MAILGVVWLEVSKLSVGEMAELLEHETWMQKIPRQMQHVGRSNLILTTKYKSRQKNKKDKNLKI